MMPFPPGYNYSSALSLSKPCLAVRTIYHNTGHREPTGQWGYNQNGHRAIKTGPLNRNDNMSYAQRLRTNRFLKETQNECARNVLIKIVTQSIAKTFCGPSCSPVRREPIPTMLKRNSKVSEGKLQNKLSFL